MQKEKTSDVETINTIQDALEYMAVNYGQLPKFLVQESLYGIKGELELLKDNLAFAIRKSTQEAIESQTTSIEGKML